MAEEDEIKKALREVPDFPRSGINFIDITPLLKDPRTFSLALDVLTAWAREIPFDVVVSPEARGFLVGAPLASRLGKGFVPARKPGKLPWRVRRGDYQLEYGDASLEIHEDAFAAGERALIVDDLLATGGTVKATMDIVRSLGGSVAACAFLVELTFLGGRIPIGDVPVFSAVLIGE